MKHKSIQSVPLALTSTHSLLQLCNTTISPLIYSIHSGMHAWKLALERAGPPSAACRLPFLSACDRRQKKYWNFIEKERLKKEENVMELQRKICCWEVSWCNKSTSHHHGNPASAPADCGKESVCAGMLQWSTVGGNKPLSKLLYDNCMNILYLHVKKVYKES